MDLMQFHLHLCHLHLFQKHKYLHLVFQQNFVKLSSSHYLLMKIELTYRLWWLLRFQLQKSVYRESIQMAL